MAITERHPNRFKERIANTLTDIKDTINCEPEKIVAGIACIGGATAIVGMVLSAVYKDRPTDHEAIILTPDALKIDKQCLQNEGINITTGPLYGADGSRLHSFEAVVFCNPAKGTKVFK